MNAQITSKKLGNKNFKKKNNNWFVQDEKSNYEFKVNTKSITVKLKSEATRQQLIELNEKYNIEIIRENKLGFVDLELPLNLKFYEIYNQYNKAALFESIDINSYGKPQGYFTTDQYEQYQAYLDYNYPSGKPYYHLIDARSTWSYYENGSSNQVVVAVIGCGVDILHSDLNIGSGTQQGYSFTYPIGSDPTPVSSMSDFDYGMSHETLVAGIIGAKTNNGLGVAGIAGGWGSSLGAKIMGLKISAYDNYGNFETTTLDDALIYATDNGAKIINMSFVINEVSSNLAAIKYAFDKGCLLVASSGNGGTNNVGFPANNSDVIAVSGITSAGVQYGYYGDEIELSASSSFVYSTLRNNAYGSFDGTSAAAPQVSGVAALLWSKYPNLINVDVRNILHSSATDLGTFDWDEYFGYGGVHAFNALAYADPSEELLIPPPNNVTISGAIGSHPTIAWNNNWNSEYSFNVDHYNIYRASTVNGVYSGFRKVAEVSDGNFSWTDNSVWIVNPRFAISRHYYRVTTSGLNEDLTEDNTIDESVTSNEVSTATNSSSKSLTNEMTETVYTYSLEGNYPNPFNPSTAIKYSLKDDGIVSLKVYDILGRIVSVLVDEFKEKGKYEITFNTNSKNLSSGLYFYKISVNGFTVTKKMLLTK